jgi:putative membrane protein
VGLRDWTARHQRGELVIDLAIRVAINGVALIAASRIVPGISLKIGPFGPDWIKIAAVALIFGLVNTYLRPIVKALALPISLLTMGAAGLVINAAMLLLVAFLSKALTLPFKVGAFPPTLNADTFVDALLGGIFISIVATVLTMLLGTRKVFGTLI